MKVIFLDTDGVLTHTDYLNWQTRHIDPEKVLEQIPSVISLDQLDIHCKHGTGRAAEGTCHLATHTNCASPALKKRSFLRIFLRLWILK